MSIISKWFTPRGTGGIEANLARQENSVLEAKNATQPVRDLWTGYLAGNKTESDLPSWMQVPDWQKTSSNVYDAYANAGNRSVEDQLAKRRSVVSSDRLRRGMLYGSSGAEGSMGDLISFYNTQKAQSLAEALAKSLSVGQNLRQETGNNWLRMLDYVGTPSQSQQYANLAQGYGNMASSNTAMLNSLLGAAGMAYGASMGGGSDNSAILNALIQKYGLSGGASGSGSGSSVGVQDLFSSGGMYP